jgi:putative transposase
LEGIVRRETSTQQQVRRAKVVLAAADGANNEQVARQVGVTDDTARDWRARWVTDDTARDWRARWVTAGEAVLAAEAEGGDDALRAVVLGVLADEPRPGAPATFTPEQICRLVALACTPVDAATSGAPGTGRPISHWTPRELADEAVRRGIVPRISPQSVGRFLKRGRPEAAPEPVLAHPGAR